MPNFSRGTKPALKVVHTWTGLISGLFLSVVALTGSVITFRAEFERAALPQSTARKSALHAVSLAEAARQVAIQRPDSRIRRVRIPFSSSDPYIFQVESADRPTERIVSDQISGRVLGTQQSGWVEWMVDLHRNLLSGKTGRKIVGVIGILLFVLTATGLLMWLVGPHNWRSWISVRRRGSALRFAYGLHRATGLWAYAFWLWSLLSELNEPFPIRCETSSSS